MRRNDEWRWLGYRATPELAKGLPAYIQSDAALRSITTTRLLGAQRPAFISDQELFTDEEYATDPIITDWLGPDGMHHGAATAIQAPTDDLVVVQFMRRAGKQGFDRDDLDRLDAYRPHLARAGLLAARWRLERLRAIAEAMALIGLPAAVLDVAGRVVAANLLIQAMTTHVVWLPKDRIGFTDAEATLLLRQAIAEIGDPAPRSVRSFPARGKNGREAVVVHLVPSSRRSRDLFEGGFGILVVAPISAPEPPSTALIWGLFDLTPAEARVACEIVEGLTIDEMATRHGVVRETVRTQVKAVLAKTGVRRQAEAAAKLAALPRIVNTGRWRSASSKLPSP